MLRFVSKGKRCERRFLECERYIGGLNYTLFSFSLRSQKRGADERVNQIRNQNAETDVRQEMIGHMNPIIAVDKDKHTSQRKCNHVFWAASLFHHVGQHRQRKHHARNRHIAAGPALEVIIVACQITGVRFLFLYTEACPIHHCHFQ